eukprot:jgi/Chrzof1/8123/UNPLg00168.t1
MVCASGAPRKATHLMPVSPTNTALKAPVAASHSSMLQSWEAVATKAPSGENTAAWMVSLWSVNTARRLPVYKSNMMAVLLLAMANSFCEFGEKTTWQQ